MGFSKLFVVLQVLVISIILLASQLAGRELVETSNALNPYHKMDRELIRVVKPDNPRDSSHLP